MIDPDKGVCILMMKFVESAKEVRDVHQSMKSVIPHICHKDAKHEIEGDAAIRDLEGRFKIGDRRRNDSEVGEGDSDGMEGENDPEVRVEEDLEAVEDLRGGRIFASTERVGTVVQAVLGEEVPPTEVEEGEEAVDSKLAH
jgi:hypothetical protein